MKILITGARGGMGRDAAFELARRGHEVIATTRTAVQAEELKKESADESLDIQTLKLDILEAEDRKIAVELEPDVLINNAAIGESGPIVEVPMKHVRENFETNVFSTLALTQGIAKKMIKKGGGRIITFSSVAGKITLPYLGAYSMTKHALESMSDALRQELRHHNIFVSVIEPGAIGTGFNERMNATKYKWFSENSLFAGDADIIKGYEKVLVHDQENTSSITKAVVHAVESPKPKTRYVRPRTLMVWLAQVVPDSVRDWMIRRRL